MAFPRIRPYEGGNIVAANLSDRDLVQLYCAFRIFNHELELTLSTRESPLLRENLLPLGVTTMSAGSKTNPGGMHPTMTHSNSLRFQTKDRLNTFPPCLNPEDMILSGKIGILPMILLFLHKCSANQIILPLRL